MICKLLTLLKLLRSKIISKNAGSTQHKKMNTSKDEKGSSRCKVTLEWSNKNGKYNGAVKLGILRKKFTEISSFKINKKQVLAELSRDNGKDKELENNKYKNELTLIVEVDSNSSKVDKEKMNIEVANVIEKNKHLLHYILEVNNLEDNVYSCIKDSKVLDKIKLSNYEVEAKDQKDKKTTDKSKKNNKHSDIQVFISDDKSKGFKIYWGIQMSDVDEINKQVYELEQRKLKEFKLKKTSANNETDYRDYFE